jgi:hypothetical protein
MLTSVSAIAVEHLALHWIIQAQTGTINAHLTRKRTMIPVSPLDYTRIGIST